MAQTIITSPFTENRMVISVTHTSHGFDSGDLGKPMRSSGVNGRFVVAQADSATNAEVVGVLTSVEDVNNYTITSTGIVDAAAAIPDAATAGQVLFVSQTADTVLTTTEPTAVGQVSKPVAVIIEQNAKMLLIHYRGEVITSTTQTNAPNDATYLTTSANSTLSNEVVVGGSVGSSITVADADGFVVNDGGTVKVIPATDIKTYAQAIKIDDLTAGDDNTDLDSSTSRHGLLRKLDNSTTNFLRGDGAWAAAGGGALTLIGSTNVTSNTTNIDFTGLSGYETYFLQISGAVPSADGPYAVMQVGDSSGFDTAQNEYGWHNLQIRANTTTVENTAFAHTTNSSETTWVVLYRRGVGSDTNEGFSCSLWIHNKPNQFTRIHGTYCATSYLNETQGGLLAAERRAAITMDRVRFKFSSGSVESGRISLYGVAHA